MKADFQKLVRASRLPIVFCSMLILAGCQTDRDHSLTTKLWNDRNRRSIEEPSPQPNLSLFEVTGGKDVVVQYDEMTDQPDLVTRRAYLLNENQKRIAARKKPVFVKPSSTDGLKVIPVVSTEIDNTPNLEDYAILSKDRLKFTLHRKGMSPQQFDLPVYQEVSGIVKQVTLDPLRVAVTPITVTRDAMTGAMSPTPDAAVALETSSEVIYWATFMWLWAGAPGVNY
jgi:hypothetical protein